jgi:hypothetical protein
MDVIRHEAIGPYFEAVSGGKIGEQLRIPGVIPFLGEYGLPVIPPLREVVGITDGDSSGYSWHGWIIEQKPGVSTN